MWPECPRRRSRLKLWVLAATLACLPAAGRAADPVDRDPVDTDTVEVRTESLRVSFSLRDARLIELEAIHPDASAPDPRRLDFRARGDPPPVRVVFGSAPGGVPDGIRYSVRRGVRPDASVLTFTSPPLDSGVVIEQVYEIDRQGYVVHLALTARGPGAEAFLRAHVPELEISAGRALEVEAAPGLGGLSEHVRVVVVDGAGARDLEPDVRTLALASGAWLGVRNRFWALVAASEGGPTQAQVGETTATLRPEAPFELRCRIYAGPVERTALARVDPDLAGLLFMGRWLPIRALAVGLLLLLALILPWTGDVGLAIILLSIVVKVLMLPLSHLADRLQRDVNETRTHLEPGIGAIRREYRGGERGRRLLEFHRERGVHPLFAMKGLVGVLIQIPVFIAAYHMLDENFALYGAHFLWITDLSRPDRVGTLPFALPGLGDGLNLLPLLMAAATLLSSRIHDDGSLAPELLKSQRRGLYAMAAAFLLLFYTFPAGMVLYWTTNNIVSLVKNAIERVTRWTRQRGIEVHDVSSV